MKFRIAAFAFTFFLIANLSFSQSSKKISKDKQEVIRSIEKHREALINLSDQIWAFAETALRESKSSEILADFAESQGFNVERGIAGMPTAFLATYGSGNPIIGILGEYDALPGISQKASPEKEPLHEGAAGHVAVIICLAPAAWVQP